MSLMTGGLIMTFVVVGCVCGGCFEMEIEVAPVWVACRLDEEEDGEDSGIEDEASAGEWLGRDAVTGW